MRIGGRPLSTLLAAPLRPQHYIAAANMFRVYKKPLELYHRYLTGGGGYPATVEVRTPLGELALEVYSSHDVLTVNEIFCRGDYRSTASDTIFVDFGSNIGISAAYFLSRSPSAFAYLYEPLPRNVERLRRNLRAFEGRYSLAVQAVGLANGAVSFGWEETGRYGGVGKETGCSVEVDCVDSNDALAGVIARHGRIDVLKVDIETLERQVVERIPVALAERITRVFVEYQFASNPLARTHQMRQYGSVARFARTCAA